MNFMVIGNGFIYSRHKKAIEDLGHKIAMVCTSDDDWLEMYNSPIFDRMDAVVILTPNYTHGAMAREALRKGKRVLCEKPLSIDGTDGLEGVDTVLQLRYHPALKGLKPKKVDVVAKMYRDEKYWDSWKGDKNKSGGILWNLGIHYIDLLIFLLGDAYVIKSREVSDKLVRGEIQFDKGWGKFHIEIVDSPDKQGRSMLVDGKEINLSNKENLSYEDLHKLVYEDFIKGEGIPLSEVKKSHELVRKILWNTDNAKSV